MRLSIITINFNNKDGLQKTIDSVITQTFKDFEWIIIDGGSTDGSKELIEQYSLYITYWVSEPDNGIYHAMNKGILQAKGEYLQFLNSGDTLYSRTTLKELFLQNLYGDIIYGNVIFHKGNKILKIHKYDKALSLEYFLNSRTINHQASLIKKDLFKDNLYNEKLQIVADWEYWIIQMILQRTFQYIDKILILYDFTGLTSQITNLQNYEIRLIYNEYSWTINEFLNKDYIKKLYLLSRKNRICKKLVHLYIILNNYIYQKVKSYQIIEQ